ncbi:MAG: RCC1 domain-containing protein [Acidimicrobiia bacterium]
MIGRNTPRSGIFGAALLVGSLVGIFAPPPLASGAATSTPVINAGDTYVVEGTFGEPSLARFPVTLSEPSTVPVMVTYTFTPGSADTSDYLPLLHGPKVLKFTPSPHTGVTPVVKYVSTEIFPDSAVELGQVFHLALSAPTGGASLGRDTGDAVIINDDPTAASTVSIGGAAVVEGDAGPARKVEVPVRLSTASTSKVQISYRVSAGTATAGSEFNNFRGRIKTLTFAPKASTGLTPQQKSIVVPILPDTTGEATETVEVTLLGATNGYSPVRDVGEVSILNDDPVVWSSVSAGDDHTCGLVSGASFCWGLDGNGELGDAAESSTAASPVRTVSVGADLTQVASGDFHTCARATTGAAYCWGMNSSGQIGDGTTTDRNVPTAVTALGSGVASIGAGGRHSCAVTTAGELRCWGDNNDGEVGDGTTTDRNVPVTVTGFASGVAEVAVGSRHACARTTDGAVWCWGANGSGQLGDGSTTPSAVPVAVSGLGSGVAHITAGDDTTCAVTDTGAASCWGANGSGQLGDGSTTPSAVPVAVSGLGSGVTRIDAGGANACAVTTAGAAYCWGDDFYGQLGDDTQNDSSVPVLVPGFASGAAQITAGTRHECLVAVSGAAYCWGSPAFGALGNHGVDNGPGPQPVDDP